MTALSRIAPGDWITIGEKDSREAVVCTIRPGIIEAVYLDEHNKAVHRDVVWSGSYWNFAQKETQPKNADKDPRLQPYVKILRSRK